jgi:hypothetical protein
MSDADLKDHRQDHQLLLVLNRPISESVDLVLVQVQRTHLEEGEQEGVDFHPHCNHMKKKTYHNNAQAEEGTTVELGSQAKEGTNAELGSQSKIFSSNLTSFLIIVSLE